MSDAALRMADRLAIIALNDGFGRALDHNDLAAFLALFTPDVAYCNGPRVMDGHPALEAFFTKRAASGRVSRHLYSGLSITFDGADRAHGQSVWMTFAGAGPLPVSPAEPFSVTDVEDIYHRDSDGVWRIAKRQITPVFRNAAMPGPEARG